VCKLSELSGFPTVRCLKKIEQNTAFSDAAELIEYDFFNQIKKEL